jgi:signal transduction histidine kinase
MRWAALVAEQKDADDPKPTRATIIVGETLGKREAVSRQTLYLTSLPQIGLVALLGVLAWFAVRRGLRPLHELRTRVQQRSEADLHPITADGKSREIDALRDALNGFMVRLDRALAIQGEFVGNAAHQLRTPLAAMKARLDYAGRKHAQAEETIAELRPSVDRCVRLVDQLLALAHVDVAHPPELAAARVDVVCQVRELVREMTGAALARNVDLGLEATTEPLYAVTNPTLLAELLRNLVDNALCYTPPGGRVTVRLEHASEHITILVSDNGPGIAEHDRAHVFERFYRGRDAPGTGSGLGLCIARRCAAVIGAEVDLVPSNAGACFAVTLPGERPLAVRGA